ncbi:coil containing protein [Vibrio phage 1.084.O._10N.261.49.F5]|nr:coil containing protein [Vibrio phage 1.084.O._10N.261.49.F5]
MNKNDIGTTGIAIRSLEIAVNSLDGILRGETMNHLSLVLNAREELTRLEKVLSRVKKEHEQNSRTFAQMSIESTLKSVDTYKGQGVFFGSDNVITHKQ